MAAVTRTSTALCVAVFALTASARSVTEGPRKGLVAGTPGSRLVRRSTDRARHHRSEESAADVLHFADLDLNRDGVITKSEMDKVMAMGKAAASLLSVEDSPAKAHQDPNATTATATDTTATATNTTATATNTDNTTTVTETATTTDTATTTEAPTTSNVTPVNATNITEDKGEATCPCIEADLSSEEVPSGVNVKIGNLTVLYPEGLGSKCLAWDQFHYPGKCTEENAEFCGQEWCFVDPCNCDLKPPPRKSSLLPSVTYKNKSLYFSYATCGGTDFFSKESKKKSNSTNDSNSTDPSNSSDSNEADDSIEAMCSNKSGVEKMAPSALSLLLAAGMAALA